MYISQRGERANRAARRCSLLFVHPDAPLFATFLADVIEKYASVLEIDNAVWRIPQEIIRFSQPQPLL